MMVVRFCNCLAPGVPVCPLHESSEEFPPPASSFYGKKIRKPDSKKLYYLYLPINLIIRGSKSPFLPALLPPVVLSLSNLKYN